MKPAHYATRLLRAMVRKQMSCRDLEKALKDRGKDHSYEHIRRIAVGAPIVSDRFNHDVCEILNLREDGMWQLAQRDKFAQRSKPVSETDPSVRQAWVDLSQDDEDH